MPDAKQERRIRSLPTASSLLALIVALSVVNCSRANLRHVCRNAQVPIKSVQDFDGLNEELERDQQFEVCPRRYRQAFSQLASVMLDSNHFVCSDEKFKLIKQFHDRFIPRSEPEVEDDSKDGDNDEHNDDEKQWPADELISEGAGAAERQLERAAVSGDESQSPISLQVLFKAYALQVSGLCKQHLAENVDWAMRSLSDYDEELFKLVKFTPTEIELKDEGDRERLGKRVTIPERLPEGGLPFRELVYMPELEGELESGDVQRQQELTQVDLRDRPQLNRFMWACERRFRPVYSKLVTPIVRLAKLGYEYAGHELDRFRTKLASDEVSTWKLITLICESRGRIQLAGEDEHNLETLAFVPPVRRSIGAELWIKGAEQLASELKNSDALRLRGFQKFLHDSQLAGRNFAAAFDPTRFAWYRQNKTGISLILNTVKIMTQLMGKVVKVAQG